MKEQISRFVDEQYVLLKQVGKKIRAKHVWCDFFELKKAKYVPNYGTVVCSGNNEKLIPSSLMIFDKDTKKNRINVQWGFVFDRVPKDDLAVILKTVCKAAKTDVRFHIEGEEQLIISFSKNPEKILTKRI